MAIAETIKGEIETGLRLLAFKSVELELAPLSLVDETLRANHWNPISAVAAEGYNYCRYYYSTAMKAYALVSCNGYDGKCSIAPAEEGDVLEKLSFPELKALGDMIDKKSVAFIRIFSERQLASAGSEEELKALTDRKARMIEEAEVALRKR